MRSENQSQRVTMPKWPAWVLFASMAACAYPALSASSDTDRQTTAKATAAPVTTLASALR
jgi:hypothetical protein